MPPLSALIAAAGLAPAYAAWLVLEWRRGRNRGSPAEGARLRPLIGRYALAFAFPFALLLIVLAQWQAGEPPSIGPANALEKVAAYRQHASDFDLLFVGDSRAYCAMHPERLDPLLGVRSLNLAHWAHWFPTQYPQMQHILEAAPPETLVVWSVGYQNFRPVHASVGTAYPIGRSNEARYLSWGFSPESLRENLAEYGDFDWAERFERGRPSFTLGDWLDLPGRLRARLDRWSERRIAAWRPARAGLDPAGREQRVRRLLEQALEEVRRDPAVRQSEVRTENDGGRLTSLAVVRAGGGYERIELDPDFFRMKQREHAAELARAAEDEPKEFEPDPAYWNNFAGVLDLFAGQPVRLIVNEMAEAPYTALSPERRARFERFMASRVRPFVESRGFPYVRVPWETFTDEDYFDYNHLNRRGIEKFTPLLAEALRPYTLQAEDRRGQGTRDKGSSFSSRSVMYEAWDSLRCDREKQDRCEPRRARGKPTKVFIRIPPCPPCPPHGIGHCG
ncbi:MAG: hypothetical protein HYU36_01825 [Planctomycetes bacterium]|nr:hypothetical protein [Planctomycetota bacterium]